MPSIERPDAFPCISQEEDDDCLPACVASVTQYLGRPISLAAAREMLGTVPGEGSRLGALADLPGLDARTLEDCVAWGGLDLETLGPCSARTCP